MEDPDRVLEENQQRDRRNDHVLRPKDLAEDDKFALEEIQQEERLALQTNERPGEHHR